MKVSGFEIRQGLNLLQMQKEVFEGEFEDSLTAFEGEVKRSPAEVAKDISGAEEKIALLQEAQAFFNLNVTVTVYGKPITLCRAVKSVGGINRAEKRWTTIAKAKKDPYGRGIRRDKEEVYATSTITSQDALKLAKIAAGVAAVYKGAIANANSTQLDIPFLPAGIIE